jgi:hypothetical protein
MKHFKESFAIGALSVIAAILITSCGSDDVEAIGSFDWQQARSETKQEINAAIVKLDSTIAVAQSETDATMGQMSPPGETADTNEGMHESMSATVHELTQLRAELMELLNSIDGTTQSTWAEFKADADQKLDDVERRSSIVSHGSAAMP